MKSFYRKTSLLLAGPLLSLIPFLANAALTPPEPPGGVTAPITVQDTNDIVVLITAIMDWMFYILMALAVVMFLVGGYRYVTSAGEPESVKKANKTLMYAAIAAGVGLLAKGLPNLVFSFFGL